MTDIKAFSDNLTQSYEIEEEILKQLLLLENEFREHNALVKKELQLQKELVSRMWVLSQRYVLLESTGPSPCHIPEIYNTPAEDKLLQEFTEKIQLIRNSNCHMCNSLKKLRTSCLIFEKLCAQLDMNTRSSFIVGNSFHKPIAFFIELISDLFKYFHAWLLKIRYSSHKFDPLKIDAIETYKKIIEISEDFEEYLKVGLTYCKCLRPKPVC